jgi:hypothetical protein
MRLRLLAALAALALACHAPPRVATVLWPGSRIDVTLNGEHPSLVVHNEGPGTITLSSSGEGFTSVETMGPGTWRHTFKGRTIVALTASGAESARLYLEAAQAGGLALEVVPDD